MPAPAGILRPSADAIAQRLSFAQAFQNGTAPWLLRGAVPGAYAGGATRGVVRGGVGMVGTNGYLVATSGTSTYSLATAQGTVIILANSATASGGNVRRYLFATGNAAAFPAQPFFGVTDFDNQVYAGWANAGTDGRVLATSTGGALWVAGATISIALTYGASGQTLYIDGVSKGTNAFSTYGSTASGIFSIGELDGFSLQWNKSAGDGLIYVLAFDRQLSASEIAVAALNPWWWVETAVLRVGPTATAYTMPLSAGIFTVTGQDVRLLYGRRLPLANGSFTLSGQDIALKFGRRLALSHGSFTLTGQNVTLRREYSLPISAGTFSLSGQAVTFLRGIRLPLGTGTFTLSGQDVGLRAGRRLPLSPGSFSLTGQAVTLRRGYSMPISAGTFALTGQDLALRAGRRLSLSAGSFTLTGQPVTFSYSGSGVVNKVVLVWNGIRI